MPDHRPQREHTPEQRRHEELIAVLSRIATALEAQNNHEAIIRRLDSISQQLATITQKETLIMADLTELTAEVARNTEVDASAIALLTGLAAQIEALKTDPIALQQLADQLKGSSNDLAAAVAANTPSAPAV